MRLSTLAPTVALTVLTLVLATGCGNSTTDTPDSRSGTEVQDCDAEDRRRSEVPDCGRIVNGKFVAWSWVASGKSIPPAGWTPAQEPTPSPSPTASPTAGDGPNTKPTTRKTTKSGGSKTRR